MWIMLFSASVGELGGLISALNRFLDLLRLQYKATSPALVKYGQIDLSMDSNDLILLRERGSCFFFMGSGIE